MIAGEKISLKVFVYAKMKISLQSVSRSINILFCFASERETTLEWNQCDQIEQNHLGYFKSSRCIIELSVIFTLFAGSWCMNLKIEV